MFSVKNTMILAICTAGLLMMGCGGDDDSADEMGAGGAAAGGAAAGGEMAGSDECTAENEVCFDIKIPDDYPGDALNMTVGLFSSLPPMAPPTIFPPHAVVAPTLVAGETYRSKQTIPADKQGTYQAYIVLYMPDGGLESWIPVAGVDYAVSSEAFDLTGPAFTYATELVLTPAE